MNKSQSRSFSYNIKSAHNENKGQITTQQKSRSSSLDKSLQQTKLPVIKIKQVMKKIGALQSTNLSFTPTDQQRTSFRKQKWQQLKEHYSNRKGHKQPFQYQLDQIVLDCWDYGESYGRRTVWRKYKQKFDQLTFDTLKVVHKKRI